MKYNFGKRPSQAYNCNMFSCGGKAEDGGMPSAHMAFMGILVGIVYNIYRLHNSNDVLYMYAIMVTLTATSRYLLKCHTPLQIVIGYIVGVFIGFLYYLLDNKLDKEIDIYHTHRQEFYNHFR